MDVGAPIFQCTLYAATRGEGRWAGKVGWCAVVGQPEVHSDLAL